MKHPIVYQVYAYNIHYHNCCADCYSYRVSDLIPSVIFNMFKIPNSALPHEAVKVSATVTEPPEAGRFKNVTLCYTTNDNWSSLDMNKQEWLWSAIILDKMKISPSNILLKPLTKKATPPRVPFSIIQDDA